MPRVLGIDSSLTATGLARIDVSNTADDIASFDIVTATVGAGPPGKDKTKRAMTRRVCHLIDQIEPAFEGVDAVGIEGLAYSAGNSSAWVLAYVWGRVIELCERHDVPLTVVATSAVKKFAVGKGAGPGTDKDHVLAAAIKLFPAADLDSNNEADAAIVGATVCQQLGLPILPVTQYRTEVMAKLGD